MTKSIKGNSNPVRLVYPHQVFEAHLSADINTHFVFVEDDLYFRQYAFHKQKLLLHRVSMQNLYQQIKDKGYTASYIESSSERTSMQALEDILKSHKVAEVSYYDLVDNWLYKRLSKITYALGVNVTILDSPGFLTTNQELDDYFDKHPNRMQQFYVWQRRRLNILIDSKNKPVGGKWNYDINNRKKFPKNLVAPKTYPFEHDHTFDDASKWVDKNFADNPGSLENFGYAYTHKAARKSLNTFIKQRLATFGPYEDAISTKYTELFHSVLSPLLNSGLLTPGEVVEAALKHHANTKVPIESLEGFIRQIIGWREYMRATYVQYGNMMRTGNKLQHTKSLSKGWWDGTTSLDPIDHVIKNVLKSGYAHHIERLMILGNAMTLLRINPDEVYEWFMSLFIDAYDWVMVPNVYAMSQFAAGEMITTKPYVSGSNYVLKMSDHKKGEWSDSWDALYWQFISDNYKLFQHNPRVSMVVRIFDNFDDEKKKTIKKRAARFLK
jgi:deoxyribodipyrimidine photolyase-related protein